MRTPLSDRRSGVQDRMQLTLEPKTLPAKKRDENERRKTQYKLRNWPAFSACTVELHVCFCNLGRHP